MKRRLLLLLLLLALFLPYPWQDGFKDYPLAFAEESPVYFRGQNYSTLTYPNGTVTWLQEIGNTAVWNGTNWTDYIFERNIAEDYYQVQMGLIAARLYKGKVVYYKPDMSEVAVDRENWLVFKWNGTAWNPVCATLAKYFQSASVYEGDDYANITAAWSTAAGVLNITYHFRNKLKHNVHFTANSAGRYAVVQFWNGTHYDKVMLENATILRRTDDVIIGKSDALTVLFFNETQPFGIFENQYSSMDRLHKVMFAGGTLNYQGISVTDAVAWVFYNQTLFNLAAGETLTIDPSTYSSDNPAEDGDVELEDDSYTRRTNFYELVFTDYGSSGLYRGYAEWDITSIPDNATILNTVFKYHGYKDTRAQGDYYRQVYEMQLQPTATPDTQAGNQALFEDMANGTIYHNSTSFPGGAYSVLDLGTDADSTLESRLSSDWFAIGFQGAEARANIKSEEYDAHPKPTLEVTYSAYTPSIGEFAAPSVVIANTYFYLNATIQDPDTVDDFFNATIAINGTIILKWNASANSFSEYSDSNNYCTLDAAGSLRTTLNSTAYRLSWRIKLSWSYPAGSIHVLSTDTKVYDLVGYTASGGQASLFTFDVNTFALGHFSGNATVDSWSYNSTTSLLAIAYSNSPSSYLLVVEAAEPTYLLNCTYDQDNYADGEFRLTHYGNVTLTLSYEDWGTTRVYSCDHLISATNLETGTTSTLYVTLTGSSGQQGILEVYCGTRGIPTSTMGLTSTDYSDSAKLFSGTYTFASDTTVSVSWTSDQGTPGTDGDGSNLLTLFFVADTLEVGALHQGTSKTVKATATWRGMKSLMLTAVSFSGDGSEWMTLGIELPAIVERVSASTTGTFEVPIIISIPSGARLGSYNVLVQYSIAVGGGVEISTANILFSVTTGGLAPGEIPMVMTVLLFISLLGVVLLRVRKGKVPSFRRFPPL